MSHKNRFSLQQNLKFVAWTKFNLVNTENFIRLWESYLKIASLPSEIYQTVLKFFACGGLYHNKPM